MPTMSVSTEPTHWSGPNSVIADKHLPCGVVAKSHSDKECLRKGKARLLTSPNHRQVGRWANRQVGQNRAQLPSNPLLTSRLPLAKLAVDLCPFLAL